MGSCFSVKIKAESPLHDGMLACCFSTYLTSNSFTCSLLRSCGFWLLKHAIQHLYPAFFFEWFLISFIGMDLCFGFSVAEHWCFVWFSIWIYMKIFVLFDWFMNLNSKSLCNCWLKKRKKKTYVIICYPSYIVGLIQVRLQLFSPSNIDDNKILKFKSWI